MARIVLASPVPPMNTGTAPYLGLFIAAGLPVLRSQDVLIVTTAEFGRFDHHYMGMPVVAVEDYDPDPDDVVIAFFANNRFHRFAYAIAEAAERRKRLISVLHEPQCFHAISNMYSRRGGSVDMAGLAEQIKYEMPKLQEWILAKFSDRCLPQIVSCNLVAQSKILGLSDAIIVHSYYAGLKLSLESSHGAALPEIIVMQFPHDQSAIERVRGRPDKFTVGCFGWIALSKRPLQVIKGFAKFLLALPEEARSDVELKFAGSLVDKTLDPLYWARVYGVESYCVHLSGLSDEAFAREMESVSLLCNLRFPSCGETSGTLNLARDTGVRVAMSCYQAFREEEADYFISLDPEREIGEISAAIMAEYQRWRWPDTVGRTRTEQRYALPKKFSVAEAISYILAGA
ncbi:MAG: glycosyltransferase [Proteobacteria bacterium]|nr:glycosyltransferase [Pseudomonadota bacterium]